MTSINRLGRALTTLRQVLSERSGIQAGITNSNHEGTPVINQAVRNDKTRQIRRRIKERLSALNLSQSADQERGTAIFLEMVLTDEFGTELLEDPSFYNLLADVKGAILSDQETQKDFLSMLVDLRDSD